LFAVVQTPAPCLRTLQYAGASVIGKREGGILGRIQEQGGFVVIDSRGCEPRRLCYGYQAFGLLCAERKVRAALVRTGNEDADGHYTLRDILLTLARVAGVPLRFRLAFVARSEAIVEVCRSLQKDLAPLGCEIGVFPAERQAFEWLRGGELQAPRAPVQQRAPAFQ
jgi:hypothetical protein